MKEDELMSIAMGVEENDDLKHTAYWQQEFTDYKQFMVFRREARRIIYNYRNALRRNEETTDKKALCYLETYVLPTLNANLGRTIETFTFSWDVHPKDVKVMILPHQWFKAGGSVDDDTGAKKPPAFTEQE